MHPAGVVHLPHASSSACAAAALVLPRRHLESLRSLSSSVTGSILSVPGQAVRFPHRALPLRHQQRRWIMGQGKRGALQTHQASSHHPSRVKSVVQVPETKVSESWEGLVCQTSGAWGARIQNPKSKNLVNAAKPLVEALDFFAAAGLRGGRYAMPAMWESLRILSVITQPDVIERILHHLDLPTEPPSSSRAPPARLTCPGRYLHVRPWAAASKKPGSPSESGHTCVLQ